MAGDSAQNALFPEIAEPPDFFDHRLHGDVPVLLCLGVAFGQQRPHSRQLVHDVTLRLRHPRSVRQPTIQFHVLARLMTLEAALEYIEDDELVEITPTAVRMRKRILDESQRKRSERQDRDREAARV